jgi:hypothetical protein
VARDDDSVHLPPALVGYLASALEHRAGTFGTRLVEVVFQDEPHRLAHHHRGNPDDVQDRHVRVGMIVECVLQRLRRVVGVVHRNEDIGEQLCRKGGQPPKSRPGRTRTADWGATPW